MLALLALFAVSCENNDNTSLDNAPFDDVIADFDVKEMDQAQFETALTTEVLSMNKVVIYTKEQGWGALIDGGTFGWIGLLCNTDGTSRYVFELQPTGQYEGIRCVNGKWSYNQATQEFTIHSSQNYKIRAKVIYYRHPRVILEGRKEAYKSYRFRWDCVFGEMDAEELLASCTDFVSYETE